MLTFIFEVPFSQKWQLNLNPVDINRCSTSFPLSDVTGQSEYFAGVSINGTKSNVSEVWV